MREVKEVDGGMSSKRFGLRVLRFRCRKGLHEWDSTQLWDTENQPIPFKVAVSTNGQTVSTGALCPFCYVAWLRENFGALEVTDEQ